MKQLYFLCLAAFILSSAAAQNSSLAANYNVNKKRLLIQACSMYLYNSNQGAIDVDSSVVLACKAYKLPLSLSYDEGYNNGSYLIGSQLIENGNIDAAKQLLAKSKNQDKIKLLLQLGSFYLFKPGTKKEDIQNSDLYIKEAVQLSNNLKIKKWQHQSMMLLGKYYEQTNNLPESKKCFSAVTDECRKENDKLTLAQAIDNQAIYLPVLEPGKEKLLREASQLYKELGLLEKSIEMDMRIVTIHFWGGRLEMAKKGLYQTLIDMRKIGFKHEMFTESTISFLESRLLNFKSSVYYALKSVKRMEATKDYTFADIFYFRLADMYLHTEHYDEATHYLIKSIESGQKGMSSGTWFKAYMSIAYSLSSAGKNSEALLYISKVLKTATPTSQFDKMYYHYIVANLYWKQKNYALAKKNFEQMDQVGENLNTTETFRDLANYYSSMASFYANVNDARKSQSIIDKINALKKLYSINYNSTDYQIAQYKIDSLNGNYKRSLAHLYNFKSLNDSLLNTTRDKKIEELKIQYETANKEQKIHLLNKQTDLQKTALQKSEMFNNLSICTTILLLITMGLLYSRYRLKQRNNVKLELKEKEINVVNLNLRHLLDEKEWLIKEIHHRVKNNLQTVISLLNSQSAHLKDDLAISAIKNSQRRIHSMSLIHQKLYNSENVSTINFPEYITELVKYLHKSFSLGQRIRFELDIIPIELDVAQAIPLGLILNEVITNSIKYAFPDNRDGVIQVTLEKKTDNRLLLTISDDGVGFNADIKSSEVNSFGMKLIKGLSEDLESNFSFESNNGTIYKIEFRQEFPIKNEALFA